MKSAWAAERSAAVVVWMLLSIVWTMIGGILSLAGLAGLVMQIFGWSLFGDGYDSPMESGPMADAPDPFDWSVVRFLALALAWLGAGLWSLFAAMRMQARGRQAAS